MYNFNVYEDFKDGSFKLLCTYGCYAKNREEAKAIALAWAKDWYTGRNVSVTSVN